jgi:hypothetical protein
MINITVVIHNIIKKLNSHTNQKTVHENVMLGII